MKTEKEQLNEMTPVAVATAPVIPPQEMERAAGGSPVMSKLYPAVHAGTCEYCGVIDPHYKGFQYRLCPHFKNIVELACQYCSVDKDPTEVTRSHTLHIYDSPLERDQYGRPKKIVVCSGTTCEEKHRTRFNA